MDAVADEARSQPVATRPRRALLAMLAVVLAAATPAFTYSGLAALERGGGHVESGRSLLLLAAACAPLLGVAYTLVPWVRPRWLAFPGFFVGTVAGLWLGWQLDKASGSFWGSLGVLAMAAWGALGAAVVAAVAAAAGWAVAKARGAAIAVQAVVAAWVTSWSLAALHLVRQP